MGKFICKIVLFFLIVALADQVLGVAMDSVISKIDIGGVGRNTFICEKCTDDILVFGSSRAEFHYNAQMISDSLGQSCYNCGEEGCGIILAYGRLLLLKERYNPKTIIYEITPAYDFHDGHDNDKYLSRLKYYYGKPGIDSIFWSVDPKERYKMTSRIYRNNSSFLQNLIVFLSHRSADSGIKGFRPVQKKMNPMKKRKNFIPYDSRKGYEYDSLKFQYWDKFMEQTKDAEVFFVASPMWYGQDTLAIQPIKDICKARNLCLLDYTNDPKYVHHDEYFMDGFHLNATGADEFTRDLIKDIRQWRLAHRP